MFNYFRYLSFKTFIGKWCHDCLLSVSSPHRISKNFLIPCPALPTGESSSLNTSQLSKICLTSMIKSSLDLYLYKSSIIEWLLQVCEKTYCVSMTLFFTVERSIGCFIIFLYVGNCFVLTGNKNGHESSCN